MKTMLTIWKVAALSALLLLMLGSSAIAQDVELEFDEDDCEEVEVDGEVVWLCEGDDGSFWVCAEIPDEAVDGETPLGDDGEVDGVPVLCIEVDPDELEEDDDAGAGAGPGTGTGTGTGTGAGTPTGGVATGAGGAAGAGVPAGAAAAGLGALALAGAAVTRLRRS